MALSFAKEVLPLRADEDGVVRVGKTRISLDTVVEAFSEGATAEEIVQQYPSLNLADVYQVIGYYLRRPEDVDQYLQKRNSKAKAVRKKNELRFDPRGVRARLVARRASQGR